MLDNLRTCKFLLSRSKPTCKHRWETLHKRPQKLQGHTPCPTSRCRTKPPTRSSMAYSEMHTNLASLRSSSSRWRLSQQSQWRVRRWRHVTYPLRSEWQACKPLQECPCWLTKEMVGNRLMTPFLGNTKMGHNHISKAVPSTFIVLLYTISQAFLMTSSTWRGSQTLIPCTTSARVETTLVSTKPPMRIPTTAQEHSKEKISKFLPQVVNTCVTWCSAKSWTQQRTICFTCTKTNRASSTLNKSREHITRIKMRRWRQTIIKIKKWRFSLVGWEDRCRSWAACPTTGRLASIESEWARPSKTKTMWNLHHRCWARLLWDKARTTWSAAQ